MKPIKLARDEFKKGPRRNILVELSGDRQLNVLEINLGNIKPTDAVFLELEIDGLVNVHQKGDSLKADLFVPLFLSKSDVIGKNPGSIDAEVPVDNVLTEITIRTSSRMGAPVLTRAYDQNIDFELPRTDGPFHDKRMMPMTDLQLGLEFTRQNAGEMVIMAPDQTEYTLETVFGADCIDVKQKLHDRGMEFNHEVYMMTSEFIVRRDLNTDSKYNVSKRAYIFIIDNCIDNKVNSREKFESVKQHVKAALKFLANERPKHKFNIYVTPHGRTVGNQLNNRTNSFSSYLGAQVGSIFQLNDYLERALQFIDEIQPVNNSKKHLLPVFEQVMATHENQNSFVEKEYLRQVIVVSDLKYIDTDKAIEFADRNSHINFDLKPTDSNGSKTYPRGQNPSISHNRCYVLTYGMGANIEAGRELAETTFGAHRHTGLHRSDDQRFGRKLRELAKFSTFSMPGLEAKVEFAVYSNSGRELGPFTITNQQLERVPQNDGRVQWSRQIQNVADGKTRRIHNVRHKNIDRTVRDSLFNRNVHDTYQSVNNETCIFQRVMYVTERPMKVIARLITLDSEPPCSWESRVTPRVVGEQNREATLALSRGILRERICQEERYYKYHLTHRSIDEADLDRLAQLITGLSMLTGVASNMVGFVGKESKPLPSIYPESMEVDQRPVYQEEPMDMRDSPMPVSHKSVSNCGDAMTHHSEASERLTPTDYRTLGNQPMSENEQMVGGTRSDDQPGDRKRTSGHVQLDQKRNRPAGDCDTSPVEKFERRYIFNKMCNESGLIRRNEDSDSVISQMANILVENLDKIRDELLGHSGKETQVLRQKAAASRGRKKQPKAEPELLVTSLLYVVACSMVTWDIGHETPLNRLTEQQLKRNGLDNEWFKEYAKKKFEEHKISDSIQYKFSMDSEAITVRSK